jgi:N-acetylmuramic acid 6-phosphate etherase
VPGPAAATERWLPELADLDLRPTAELLGLFIDGELAALRVVRQRVDQLVPVVDAVAERFAAGGRIVYAGAGTPGRLGLLDAAECGPTFGLEPGRVTAVVAGGSQAATGAREDAEDHPEDGSSAVSALSLRPVDALIALSASGRTPFTLGAVGPAAAAGALTVAVVCDEATPLAAAVDLAVELPVGPELLAGSTRLKAGTVQKVVVNALSTLVMVRTGRTFGNLMVDLRASNAKLRDRARRIVSSATGTDLAAAGLLLDAAGGEVKTAIVTGLTGEPPASAREKLARHGGRVREAAATGRRSDETKPCRP